MITQEILKQTLRYDRETGIFYWNVIRKGINFGAKAGSIDKNGYITIMIDGKNYFAHDLAWLYEKGVWPENDIDHRDKANWNNAIENLREATRDQNMQNGNLRADNTSGHKGVSWSARLNKYRVYIKIGGKQVHIGLFTSFEDAVVARQEAAKSAYGEFYNG